MEYLLIEYSHAYGVEYRYNIICRNYLKHFILFYVSSCHCLHVSAFTLITLVSIIL